MGSGGLEGGVVWLAEDGQAPETALSLLVWDQSLGTGCEALRLASSAPAVRPRWLLPVRPTFIIHGPTLITADK